MPKSHILEYLSTLRIVSSCCFDEGQEHWFFAVNRSFAAAGDVVVVVDDDETFRKSPAAQGNADTRCSKLQDDPGCLEIACSTCGLDSGDVVDVGDRVENVVVVL